MVRIILVVALVLAGIYLVYNFLPANKVSLPSYSATEDKTSAPEATDEMVVSLNTQNDSDILGVARINEVGGRVVVNVEVKGAPEGVAMPAHIHMGACPNPGEVKYSLTNVVDGTSETTLSVDKKTLMAGLPLAVNVHKSEAEAKVYVACGDLGSTSGSESGSGY